MFKLRWNTRDLLILVLVSSLFSLALATESNIQDGTEGIGKTYIKINKATATSVYPSIGSNGLREYAPENALTKGSGYWSSDGNHKQSDVVTWTGNLKNRRVIEGVEIHWAYAPAQVSITASIDGKEPFKEVVPFQDVSATSASVDQVITFPKAIRAAAIQINMKHAIHGYFGMNLVSLIGSSNPTLRIQSGITSAFQDMCLQIDEHDDIVLDSCLYSLSTMDGRALWKFNDVGQLYNPIKNKCMTLKDNIDLDGGEIVGQDCESAYKFEDGRSIWELQPNNQFKILKGGNLCLSQKGSKAGSTDVAKNKQAKSSHPRAGDEAHGVAAAIDGHSDTYFATQDFPIDAVPEAVYFDLDLGESFKLRTAAIDWEYPAFRYTISVSNDGKNFTDVSGTLANPMHSTVNDLKSTIGRYIRLRMERPHPQFGKVEDSYVYGIRTFSIYSNRLRTIVEGCNKAKASADARDKYFLELVAEVDFASGDKLQQANSLIEGTSFVVERLTSETQGLKPYLETCKADKVERSEKVESLEAKYREVSESIGNLKFELKNIANSMGARTVSSTVLGQSPEYPALDCFNLKSNTPQSTSGFYFIQPKCSPKVLRVYCDMNLGATYYIPQENDGLVQPTDTIRVCSDHGLEPVQIHSAAQIKNIQKMMKIMGLDLSRPVPIGVNNGNGYFSSLDLKKDITEFVLGAKLSEKMVSNTVGIASEGLAFFDSSTVEMSGIICSTNKDSLNPPVAHIEIGCSTIVRGNSAFDGWQGTVVRAKCPSECLYTAEGAEVIGGEGGVYSDDSSICLAAIHAGALRKSGLVEVKIVQVPDEFEGGDQNGLISDSYSGPKKERAMTISPVGEKCPGSDLEPTSFLDVNTIKEEATLSDSKSVNVGSRFEQTSNRNRSHSKGYVNEGTSAAISQLLNLVNKQIADVDGDFLKMVEKEANKAIGQARGIMKPAGVLENDLRARTSELISKTVNLTEEIQNVAGRISQTLDRAQNLKSDAYKKRMSQTGADSWELAALNNDFNEIFAVEQSNSASGTASWQVGGSPVGGRDGRNILSQTGIVSASAQGQAAVGTFAILKDKRFFDSIFSADVYVGGSGSVGIGFRVKDHENMYLFEMKQISGGFKRLLRIVDGKPTEIARIDDGGYVEGHWYTVRIELHQARIMISVVEDVKGPVVVKPKPDIDLLDGTFASGSIAFFTSGVDSAFFDRVQVEAMPCLVKNLPPSPPLPLNCSNYREGFVSHINHNWKTVDPDAVNGPSNWKYANDIGGEHTVIAQLSGIRGHDEQTPAIAVLSGHRSCESGTFSFKFFPQCENGIVGAVFKYINPQNYSLVEVGPSFARLRKMINGEFTTSAKSILSGYKLGAWNRISVTFNGANVIVSTGNGASPIPTFNVLGIETYEGGSVGLTSYNCGGVAFSNIVLHPIEEAPTLAEPAKPTAPPLFLQEDVVPKEGIGKCVGTSHLVDRLNYCQENAGTLKGDQERCESNFCDSCCENEFPASEKAQRTCQSHCHENDHESIASLEALQNLRSSCKIDEKRNIYRICQEEEDKESCLADVCDMCCRTSKLHGLHNSRAKAFVIEDCKRSCNVN